jgi:hypothetical protein
MPLLSHWMRRVADFGLLAAPVPTDNSANMRKNAAYAKPGSAMTGYQTSLSPLEELAFRAWVQKNNVPFDDSQQADYDMRGYFKALQSGSAAGSVINANDGQMHYPDTFKTPYHSSFSSESRHATPDAPKWNVFDRLQDKTGRTVYDEPKINKLARLLSGQGR